MWHDVTRKRWVGSVTLGYDEHDRQRRRAVTGKTKADVLDKLRAIQNASDEGIELAPATLTVNRFLQQWVTDDLPGTIRATTLEQYRNVVRLYIIPVLGQERVRTLTPRHVAGMLRFLATEYERPGTDDGTGKPIRGVSPHTQRIARSVLRRALRHAQQQGIVTRNVAAIASGVRIDSAEGRTLTPDQARTLLTSLQGARLEGAFTVALALGLRLGELLGLAWPDVDLDGTRPKLTVRAQVKRHGSAGLALEDAKTRTSRRTVHLPASVAAALRTHRARQAAERLKAGELWEPLPLGVDLVFRTPAGTAIDPANFRHACYRATEAAGVGRWSPHQLRHSAASLLLAQQVPLKVVSELLGHSSIRITADVYTHLLEPSRQEAAEAMETALWGAQ